MSIFTIILLIATGTFLILLELFLLPGLVVGIIGVGLSFWGIYEAFQTLGSSWGWGILIISILSNGVLTWYAVKNMYRSRFAVKNKIDGRVNELDTLGLEVGNIGVTISDLRPEGKAAFGDVIISIWSEEGKFISANQSVRIQKIADNKIFVTTLNTL